MSGDTTEIGRVERVIFEREDHGMLCCAIVVRFRSGVQGYVSPSLDVSTTSTSGTKRAPTLLGGAVLMSVVDFFGGELDKAKEAK